MQDSDTATMPKISHEFERRLRELDPDQKVRVIVFLRTQASGDESAAPRSRAERQAVGEAVRKAAERILPEIDAILQLYGGQRLDERPGVLGNVSVETTRAGIEALAASRHVNTILEDQPIFPLVSSKPAGA